MAFSYFFSFSVAICFRVLLALASAHIALGQPLASYTSSKFALMRDLNWDMIDPPDTILKQFDALNLTQIISELARPNPKSFFIIHSD